METYTQPKELKENPRYQDQRQQCLASLSDEMIDAPIIDLINNFNILPYCFTVQCCYGHFLYDHQQDQYNYEPLPSSDKIDRVKYKIAYICLCIDNNDSGRGLLKVLNEIRLSIRDIFNFVAPSGFGKDRSILMHCRYNPIGSNIKIVPHLITRKHYI